MKPRPVCASINEANLEWNFRRLKRLSGSAKICAVVKADAYGHGAVNIARRLEALGTDFLAVAFLEEAMELRAAGIRCPILNLGSTDTENAGIILDLEIAQTVYTTELAMALSAAATQSGRMARIHIKIDTGMHRQGVGWEGAEEFLSSIHSLPGIFMEGMYSHFAEADVAGNEFSRIQLERFMRVINIAQSIGCNPPIKHMANSAGILNFPDSRLDMVRPGILLYGLSPDLHPEAPEGFLPVMCLRACIAHLRTVEKGEGISYGRIFRAPRRTDVALLQIGYADGYSRSLSGKAHVLVHGHRAPVIGRICMDQCMIDVTDIADIKLGDEVILFGTERLQAGELANLSNTISYEVTCGISKRVPRVMEEGA